MVDEGPYQYVIESVDNAVKTLMMLRERPSLRTVDVAKHLGVARSTAHRMLSTLVHSGMLKQRDGEKSYTAGQRLYELASSVLGSFDLRQEVAPLLTELAEVTGETAHFLVRERTDVTFLAVAEGKHIIRAGSRIGVKLPAHVTSAGKSLLALMSPQERDELYPPEEVLTGGTDKALTGREQLKLELAEVRERGWAINRSESEPDLMALACAVRDVRNIALGSVSLSGPIDRMQQNLDSYVQTLLTKVREFEARMVWG